MSEGHGVYVSIRNTDGALWSSSREEWALTEQDLNATFGEAFTKGLVGSLREVFVKDAVVVSGPPQQAPALQVVAPPVSAPVAVAPDEVDEVAALAAAEAALVPDTKPQFEPCENCGTPKDQWKPAGVSKAGKKYPGFYGCPNWRNH